MLHRSALLIALTLCASSLLATPVPNLPATTLQPKPQTTPPKQVYGLYSQRERLCDGGTDCSMQTDWLLLTPMAGQQVRVAFDLNFSNGHLCAAGYGPDMPAIGRWENQRLSIQIHQYINGKVYGTCQMSMRFTRNGVTFSDPKGQCRNQVCGMRGYLDDLHLPRRSSLW